MVRAILDGRKTKTRRIVKPQPIAIGSQPAELSSDFSVRPVFADTYAKLYSKIQPGDKLWVRENWCHKVDDGRFVHNQSGNWDSTCVHYQADGEHVVKVDGDGGIVYRKDGTEASP
jgi:hypothetical protein